MTTITHTSASIHARFEVPIGDQEFPELEVPVITGNQRQGDVLVLKVTSEHTNNASEIPAAGVIVVRAETNAANTHTLYALAGECLWEPNARADREDELVQGWLTVPAGSVATLLHTSEHSALGIGEGTYEIRRQREYAGEWRQVAD